MDQTMQVFLDAVVNLRLPPVVHQRIALIVHRTQQPPLKLRGRNLALDGAVKLLLRHLHQLHRLWSQTTLLGNGELANHLTTVTEIGCLWHALGWAVTPWVHWTTPGATSSTHGLPVSPHCSEMQTTVDGMHSKCFFFRHFLSKRIARRK